MLISREFIIASFLFSFHFSSFLFIIYIMRQKYLRKQLRFCSCALSFLCVFNVLCRVKCVLTKFVYCAVPIIYQINLRLLCLRFIWLFSCFLLWFNIIVDYLFIISFIKFIKNAILINVVIWANVFITPAPCPLITTCTINDIISAQPNNISQ